MESRFWCSFIFLFIVGCHSVSAEGNDVLLQRLEATEELVKTLLHRVDHLESRDKLHLHKINEFETHDQLQQATIGKLENVIQEQRHLIESMKETQQSIIIELERQRQLLESLDENLDYSNTNKSYDDPTLPNKHSSVKRSNSILTEKPDIRIRQAQFEAPVAFFAHIGDDNHLQHAGMDQVIVYDTIVTNVGNAYNGLLGTFTAPVDGIYVFSSTTTAYGHKNVETSFYRNNERINHMYASGVESNNDTSCATIVLQLSKGDFVDVHNNYADTSIHGNRLSSFSGFLLSSLNNNQNVVVGK